MFSYFHLDCYSRIFIDVIIQFFLMNIGCVAVILNVKEVKNNIK